MRKRHASFNLAVFIVILFIITLPFIATSPTILVDDTQQDSSSAVLSEIEQAKPTSIPEEATLAQRVVLSPAPTQTPIPSLSPEPTMIPKPDKLKTVGKDSPTKVIKAIKQRLSALAFYSGEIDGEYTKEFKQAVKAFQGQNGLMMNAKTIDVKTQKLLFNPNEAINANGDKGYIVSTPDRAEVIPTPYQTPLVASFDVKKLPMNDFSFGSEPLDEGFASDYSYSDPSISVMITREKIGRNVYTVADVEIKDPSQLRTALAGTPKRSATAKISKIAYRNNAVLAINGDFYSHRAYCYEVRQSTTLHKLAQSDYDVLVIDDYGDFHIFKAKNMVDNIKEFTGNIYQAFSFGPALIIDGEKAPVVRGYDFGPLNINPRTAIGQIGPLHYLCLIVDGRTSYSFGAKTTDLADYLYDRGCIQAYNLDGGGSSSMYFGKKIVNHMTGSGERDLPDIIYFASTAGIE